MHDGGDNGKLPGDLLDSCLAEKHPPFVFPPDCSSAPMATTDRAGFELVDFAQLSGVACPCGTARRAFAEVADFPGTVHVTEISTDARLHYHRRLTETYFFLECGPDAKMQLDGELIAVKPGMCVMIRPGTRHRAVGRMKVLILVLPKFDPEDEWFD